MRHCSITDQFKLPKKQNVRWRHQQGNVVDAVQGINECLF
jgi:hypothetical protein